MNKCFYMRYKEEETTGVAYCTSHALAESINDSSVIQKWTPPVFELRDGGLADYLPNDMGWRLCSEKLRALILNEAGKNSVLWLPVEVIANKMKHTYFVLHFSSFPDVLNLQKSILASQFVVKAVLDKAKVSNEKIFSFKSELTRLVVSESLMNRIMEANCTGVEFSKVPVA